MTDRRYPLEAAKSVRELESKEAERLVAERNRTLRDTEAALDAARRAAAEHRSKADGELADELGRCRTASDFIMLDQYRARLALEAEVLEAEVARARSAHEEAHRAAEAARAELLERRADHKVVEEHHARWQAAERREAEGREEKEVDDLVASRRPRAPRGPRRGP